MSGVRSHLVRFCSVWVCLMPQLSGQTFFFKVDVYEAESQEPFISKLSSKGSEPDSEFKTFTHFFFEIEISPKLCMIRVHKV